MADINKLMLNDFKIYADIDMLIDTKFSILKTYLPDIAYLSLMEDQYLKRKRDEFITDYFKCNYNLFKVLYLKRDPLILFNSSLTSIPFIIQKDFQTFLANTLAEGDKTLTLVVNFYPYKLLEHEIEFLGEVIRNAIDERIDLDFIYCDPKLIPADYITDMGIKVIYMEEGLKWINRIINSKEFFENPLTDVSLRTPKLFNWYTPNLEEHYDKSNEAEELIKLIIHIELIDPILLASISILDRNVDTI